MIFYGIIYEHIELTHTLLTAKFDDQDVIRYGQLDYIVNKLNLYIDKTNFTKFKTRSSYFY